MVALPPAGEPRRETAVREMLFHRDLVVATPRSDASSVVGGATYAYEDAWRVAEERFGSADYFLFLDHRTYVNVPYLLHVILPTMPRARVYSGCLLDETLFSLEGPRSRYLRRRRTPLFAHGMGILISADVARFVADMAAQAPLRRADIPADVAFGMWVQPMEGLIYESVHEYFHEWPRGWPGGAGGGPDIGVGSGEDAADVTRPPSKESVIVFPMTRSRWRHFRASTCTLGQG